MKKHIEQNLGKCLACTALVEQPDMVRHLSQCMSDVVVASNDHYVYLLRVYAKDNFWFYVQVSSETSLENLYLFLRKNWYECCGHISDLLVNNRTCTATDMVKPLSEVLSVPCILQYEHNTGTAITVNAEVLSMRRAGAKPGLQIVAKQNIENEWCPSCEDNKTETLRLA
jgi:hypothetical protein